MKRVFKIALPILIIIVIFSMMFVSCSKSIDEEEGLSLLKQACVKTLQVNQYYSRCSESTKEYSLNIWPDKQETEYSELMCKFTEADSSNILETTYKYYYYGASLPASIKKQKNATLEDYKTAYFYTDYITDPKNPEQCYKTNVTFDEFLNYDHIKYYTIEAIVGSIENITKDNTDVISIIKTGNVIEYIVRLNKKVNTNENSKDLYNDCQKNSKYGVIIRVTDGLISKVAINVLTSKGKIDENELPLYSNYISYVGPNLTFFGENAMPHYDEWNCKD